MPAYGYTQDDLRKFRETGTDPHAEAFTLSNPHPKPAKVPLGNESNANKQKYLLTGLDAPPGTGPHVGGVDDCADRHFLSARQPAQNGV